MLAGSNATRPAFTAAAARATIVHLAGHAIVDDERPDAAIVPLAPTSDPADAGYLTTQDIRAMNLSSTRLVVLSACESGSFRSQRYGGLDGLSGAFIAAGVKGVVGSLWRVDDLSTTDLMAAFYDSYRSGGDAARALQAAQLRLLRSPNAALRSPAAWAAFRYVGR
jgi:CHAT domain-containing protein